MSWTSVYNLRAYWARRRQRVHTEPNANGTHFASQKMLHGELLRQRAQADRAGSPFVFLRLFMQTLVPDSGALIRILAQTVRERTRVSDYMGWYGKPGEAVGVILPNTSVEGALRFVADVEAQFGRTVEAVSGNPAPELHCVVSPYPDTGVLSQDILEANPARPASGTLCG